MSKILHNILIIAFLSFGTMLCYGEKTLAFPGAEGFGAYATGGRNGQVIFVTNLSDYGSKETEIPGSLRYAVTRKFPRIILFRVSGYIELKSELEIRQPDITIAGQSAPGMGICLKNYGMRIRTSNVIIRFLRVRPGDLTGIENPGWSTDAITVSSPSKNVIIDHCSASWANDEVLSVSGEKIDSVSIQWNIISESLNKSTHVKGEHGYASLIRVGGKVSFHHNILAHHVSRAPRPGTYGNKSGFLEFSNNLIYNIRRYGYTAEDSSRMNYRYNIFMLGPDSEHEYAFKIGGMNSLYYFEGNAVWTTDRNELSSCQDELIENKELGHRMISPFPSETINLSPLEMLPALLFSGCGACLPQRDATDIRVLESIQKGKGKIINSQEETGGWPVIVSAPPVSDSDQDGMPDEWEIKKQLDPDNPADNLKNSLNPKYNNIEEYLNELTKMI